MVQVHHLPMLEIVFNWTCVNTLQVFRSPSSSTNPNPLVTGASNNNNQTTTTTRDHQHWHRYWYRTELWRSALGILTQYIGPKSKHQTTNSTTLIEPEQLIDQELKTFKECYATETHTLDKGHQLLQLIKSGSSEKYNTYKITIHNQTTSHKQRRTQIHHQVEFNHQICQGRNGIMYHRPFRTYPNTNERCMSNDTLNNLKRLDPTGAIDRLKISLQQAE